MKSPKCPYHGTSRRVYVREYDMYACDACNEWLEKVCNCARSCRDTEKHGCDYMNAWDKDKRPIGPWQSPRKKEFR